VAHVQLAYHAASEKHHSRKSLMARPTIDAIPIGVGRKVEIQSVCRPPSNPFGDSVSNSVCCICGPCVGVLHR
jgi:hypothetical protein